MFCSLVSLLIIKKRKIIKYYIASINIHSLKYSKWIFTKKNVYIQKILLIQEQIKRYSFKNNNNHSIFL